MTNEFSEPNAGGDRFSAEDAQNKRLIVAPIEYLPQIPVNRGDVVDAIKVNVVDLETGKAYYGTLWFGGQLIRAFKNTWGQRFIGYITQQRNERGFTPWVFSSLTGNPDVVALARSWISANPEFNQKTDEMLAQVLTGPAPVPMDRAQQPPAPPAWATGTPAQPAAPTWATGIPANPMGSHSQPAQAPTWVGAGTPVQQAPAQAPVATPVPDWMNPAAQAPPADPVHQQTVMDRLRAQAAAARGQAPGAAPEQSPASAPPAEGAPDQPGF